METITNSVCNIAIDNSYNSFNESVYLFNNTEKLAKEILGASNVDYSDINKIGNQLRDTCDKENLKVDKIYDEILVITDENLYAHQLNNFTDKINAKMVYEYIVPAGEDSKSLETYEKIMEYCIKINLSRKSVIIALGGGVIGDLAGYVASTYMRGIDVIQVPTSLLAQVDSSIGGKTGINIGKFKNIIGSFYQPKLTYINVSSLKTLPQDEFESGMAEVIKYAVIYDYEFLEYLRLHSKNVLNKEEDCLYNIVEKCAAIKAEVVAKDEKEGGLRKILNFGHTFGHGVEKLCKISHGYAVSIGMNMAFKLSLSEGLIKEEYYNEFLEVCKLYNLPTEFEIFEEEAENETSDSEIIRSEAKKIEVSNKVLNIMKNDKKNSFSKINLVLPTKEGQVKVIDNIENNKILEIIKECYNA